MVFNIENISSTKKEIDVRPSYSLINTNNTQRDQPAYLSNG